MANLLANATGTASVSGALNGHYHLNGVAYGAGTAFAARGAALAALCAAIGEGASVGARGAHVQLSGSASGTSYGQGVNPVTKIQSSVGATLYWRGFPGPAGYIDFETWGEFPVDQISNPIRIRSMRGTGYLLRLTLPVENAEEETYETIYPAASFGKSSSPEDVPPNLYVPGLLLGSTINYGVSLFSGIEPEASSSGGQGAIVLVDTRGKLDNLIDRSLDGAKLDVLQGDPKDDFKNFMLVAKLTTAGILYDQRKKEVRLRDQSWRAQQGRLHDITYTGEGGASGEASLTGQYKPIGFGRCRNVEPILIDSIRQIRQLSVGSINAVLAVKDGGLPLESTDIDYPNYAALAAAADASVIPLGYYSTCLAEGLIATGAVPFKQLTADFEGDAEGGYVDNIAQIAMRIATGRGDVKFSDTEIDYAALNKLAQSQPGVSGWWWSGGSDIVTKADALQEVMNSRLGYWAVRLNGLLTFGLMNEPVGSPTMVINYPNDFAGEPSQLDTYQVPRKSTFLGYKRNYTVMNDSQLVESVDPSERNYFRNESLWVNKESAFSLWKVPTAQSIRLQSGLDDESSATAECIRQQTVMGTRKERWLVPVACDPFADLLGRVIEIRNYPRYNWGASRKFICIGQSFASGIGVKLSLWG